MNAPPDEAAHQLLWDRLRRFDFDGGRPCTVSFTGRLARENGWSLAHARRVSTSTGASCSWPGPPATP